ncbi:6-O-methylguanine DNA methyltransferase [Amylibacter marinus]|uniref:6-O-methylguanine DNA methyltransferase n=1 Tax=Amylibacter marinus TaxID=1475483 RepID=A0ABQ5VVG0_9RHOB|nr:bifunctional helix-turn-helix domain-containing protein/methylated-DNA--[protein]-cysteine S-methyltransferase [Amylibacter marinus]GLQ35238.1 6-O-methylguanine DNA methyltransferase [Amylibacter marinus]
MTHDPYHYRIVARALDYIEANRATNPSLAQVAEAAGLSPTHFQRVFTKWTGVSPKKYQQYLTLDVAKTLLRDAHNTLETAHASGLSGTGRLHDMFLTWEAMSPGEYARKGAGLEIRYAWYDSPFGEMLIAATAKGICGLAFSAECGRAEALRDICARWPDATFIQDQQGLNTYQEAVLGNANARLHLIGAPFQIKVWEALLNIPSGQVTTYSDIAAAIDHPRAVRAVGTAVGKNPISWLIPCHRALRKGGGLGGYHWGLPVKRALLLHEAVTN